MTKINVKKLVLTHIPYAFIALLATKLGQAWRFAPGTDFSGKVLGLLTGFSAAFQSAMPSFHSTDLLVGITAAAIIRLVVYVKGRNAKKFRKNLEYGSARWGRPDDIRPYVDPVFENNVILTQTERLTMNSRPKDPKTARNKNVLVVGGSGSGKTRFWLKPNLMQCTSKTYPTSFVVTDPKGSMLIVQDQVWNRVTVNRAERVSTRYYIDEFHLLLKEDQTAAYSIEIWKRFRKWGGIPTGITQNVKDLLSSREVENIFENSDYVYMLNQALGDRQILAKQLNISPHQISYVTHSGEGEGLLFYGSVILPFIDRFPKDTELYKVMTTKLAEAAGTGLSTWRYLSWKTTPSTLSSSTTRTLTGSSPSTI